MMGRTFAAVMAIAMVLGTAPLSPSEAGRRVDQAIQASRGQDEQQPRGQDEQQPRGQDQQQPRGQDLQRRA